MQSIDILHHRLRNHYLTNNTFDHPHDVVSYFGAMQAQDYAAAKWAVSLRTKNATDASLEQACNEGRILRTHMMRPTWHFVAPENIRWIQALTSDRVLTVNRHMCKKLELDDTIFAQCHKILAKALQSNNYLTREEVSKEFEKHGLSAKGQRLAYIMMEAEVKALICSGPRKGKQFSYALLDERVPMTKAIPRDESLAKLALNYVGSHGPVQLRDFVWWSGLTLKDGKEAFESIKNKLIAEEIDNKRYWLHQDSQPTHTKTSAFLLSIYDEYTIAYNDRSDISEKKDIERLIMMGNALTSVIVINGLVTGTWKRVLQPNNVEINLDLFRKINREEQSAIKNAIRKYAAFIELPVNLHL